MPKHCECAHGCTRAPLINWLCLPCVGGWHSEVCSEFSAPVPGPRNVRLRGLMLALTDCGRCGFTQAEHARRAG
jgi:hypothetical protein